MKVLYPILITLLISGVVPFVHAQGKSVMTTAEKLFVGELPYQLTLQEVLDYTVEHNFDIRTAKEQIEEQEGVIIEIRAQAMPRIGSKAGYDRLDKDLSYSRPAAEENWTMSVQVRQTIYQGGAVSAAIQGQKFVREAALYQLEAVINAVLLQARIQYYEVLLQRERIEVEKKNIRLLEEQLTNTKSRFESGVVSQFEVLRSEVYLANAQPKLIRATNSHKIAADRLRQTTGFINYDRHPEKIAKFPEFTGSLSFSETIFELKTILDEAVQNRPELKRLDRIVSARKAGIDVAKGDYLPKVELVSGYGLNKSPLSARFDRSLDGWTAGVEASWAIFDGAATRGRVRQSYSRLRQAEIAEDAQRLAIEVEVREAYSSWKESIQLVTAAQKVVEQAEEAYRLANARFEAGAATQLDVLQSQVSLAEARNQKLEATYLHEVAVAKIKKAIGLSIVQKTS